MCAPPANKGTAETLLHVKLKADETAVLTAMLGSLFYVYNVKHKQEILEKSALPRRRKRYSPPMFRTSR